ncbi:1-acyl-sn-glycerol-3-phosphate acyltransferase [Geofilum rubicundum]|uniref:Hemolysin A n=1 Tax=Geofilum rubicundum JCM 15548 TaxID=1236989 RepID=A0A0E9LZL6_9BACT|nr:1-acyl-sn-glycerol-3-phosphate acyltransferase [Geofilum rubicundum]GAO31002.1 hemolysin A [Geofilum rubicundum JCM 15548]
MTSQTTIRNPKEGEELLIDIEQVFANKNPALLKTIPGFIIRYLKRITHQDGVNRIITQNNHIKGLPFSQAILDDFGVKFNTIGLENIPEDGRYLFASNHPLGGMDGIAFLTATGQRFPNIKFPVNDILMHIKGLNNIFLPVNKHGGHSREAARVLEETYQSDAQILFFPAGLVSRKQQGGIIKDLEWKRNFIKKAIQHQRDVVPVHISGHNTPFFYNLAKWRKRLGIKANIEMLYLADEMFKQKGENLTIRYGQPVPWQSLKNEKDAAKSAEKIKEMVYALAKND